jgi:hypothetical protein
MMLTPTTTRITLKGQQQGEQMGGRTVAAAVAAATANQRICPPIPPLVLYNAGTTAIIVLINKAGIPLSKLPMAAIVHASAGQKEEAPGDNCYC